MSTLEVARKHHAKHGDMDGETCLLAECALHYPPKDEVIIFKAANSKEADWVLKRLQTWKGREIKIVNMGLAQNPGNKTTIYFSIEAVE